MSKGLLYLPVRFKKNFCHEVAGDQAEQLDSAVSLEELKEAVASRTKVAKGEEITKTGLKTGSTSPYTVSLHEPSEKKKVKCEMAPPCRFTSSNVPCNPEKCCARTRFNKEEYDGMCDKSVRSSHPYRLAAVCLGLLCALLLAATLALSILYMRVGEDHNPHQSDITVEGVTEQLRANCSVQHTDKDQVPTIYTMFTEDYSKLQGSTSKPEEDNGHRQKNNKKLAEEKDQQLKALKKLAEEKGQLLKKYLALAAGCTQLQKNCSALSQENSKLQTNYSTLESSKKQLAADYNILAKENSQRESSYNALEMECRAQGNKNKRLEEEKNTLQQLLEEEKTVFLKWNRTFTVVLENNKHRDQLRRDFDAVSAKSPYLDQYCPLSSQKRVCKPCPQGWEQFYSKCYYFSTERKSWTDSRSDCIKQGADLVIVKSEEEQDFITKYTRDYNWIGLSDSVTEDTWLWVDGSPLQRGFWRNGQPDDHYWFDSRTQYQDADCVVTVPGENAWMDTHCYSYRRFICETDALLL